MYNDLKSYFSTPSSSVLTLHLRPDMDSLGSNLALYHVLKSLGHMPVIYSQDPVPQDFLFMPGAKDIVVKASEEIQWEDTGVYWALDQANLTRSGDSQIPQKVDIINIDHHATNTNYGKLNFVEPESPSTCSILMKIFKECEIDITPIVAQCLMFGLAGDTGFFHYAVNPEVFDDAADLLRKKADYTEITFEILRNMPFKNISFLSDAFATAELIQEKKCMVIALSHDLWKKHGSPENGKVLIEGYLSQITETDLGILLIEESPNNIRVSLRARNPEYNVSELAEKIGGGGHPAAAGGRMNMSLEEAKKKILELV